MSRTHQFRSAPILAALSLLLLVPLGACQDRTRNEPAGAEDVYRTTATPGAAGQPGQAQPGQVTAGGSASQQMNRGDDSTRRTGVAPDTSPAGGTGGDRGSAGAGGGMGGGMGGAGGAGGMGGSAGDRTGSTAGDTTRATAGDRDTTKKTDDKTGTKKTDDKKGTATTSTDTTRTTASDTNR